MNHTSKRYIFVLLLLLAAYSLSGCASAKHTEMQEDVTVETVNMEDEWGIQVVGVRPTAEGRMLNFRYKIIDSEKAASLISPANKPYLVDQKTGNKFAVPSLPKVGALKQRGKKAYEGRIYFILFTNTGNSVQSGDMVTVVIGNFRQEDIIVE